MTRLLVCGGRDFADTVSAYKVLDAMHRALGIDVIIEGDARGADRIAGFWARKTARMIDGKVLCSACMFAPNRTTSAPENRP